MRRTYWIERPGVDGVVTDVPAHQLPARNLARGGDAVVPNGLLRQRRGWAYDGTTADVGSNLSSAYRAKFVLADVTRTLTTRATIGSVLIHNPTASGTQVAQFLAAGALPRCIYNDELLFCSQDGITPVYRYSGAGFLSDTGASSVAYTANTATLTAGAGTFGADVLPGSYVGLPNVSSGANRGPISYGRILERISSTVLTVEGVKATNAYTIATGVTGYGTSIPCVNVYDAGTGSFDNANDEFDGTGVKWVSGDWGAVTASYDALLVLRPTGLNALHMISSASAETTIELGVTDKTDTNLNYNILRAMPFKDAASHKGSLWGTGVAQHKSRVYVGPIGWNVSFPPGFTQPYDPSVLPESDNYLDFLMDFVDVPAPNDADECVALLPSANPLVVPKRKDAYGIFGSYGALEVSLLPGGEGAGCMDIRSAHSLSIGPVWAGPNGVFAFYGGQVRNLTTGRIEREWQDLAADFDFGTSDYCTIGEKDGVMVVHLTTAGGTIQRTWHLYPFAEDGKFGPRWYDRVSNFSPRYMFSSKVQGEDDKLLAVQDIDQGRVINYAPAIDGTGIARDGDGTSPALDVYMSSRLARDAGANVDERVLEIVVEANLTDSGGTSSTLGGSVVSTQALDSTSTTTTSLTSMASKTADMPVPYVHDVGVKAGLHQLRLAKSATQTTETITEISRVGVTVRASKRPT